MAALMKVPGLDYLAHPGEDPNVSFGVIQAIGPDGQLNTMEGAVCRRLYPHDRPLDPTDPWHGPTCEHYEVMLPGSASDELWKPQALCRAYDRARFPTLRDVMFSVTLRAPELEGGRLRIHEFHRIVTSYARARLVEARGLPVIVVVHVPARAAMPGPVHWHLLTPCRRLTNLGPTTFCTELLEAGRPTVEREWKEWRSEGGQD